MGNAEIALALSTLVAVAVGALGYFIRDRFSDVKEQGKKINEQDVRLTKLEASSLAARVDEHGTRLVAIESGLVEIKGELREQSTDLRYMRRWVESQSDPSHRRRSSDHGEETSGRAT